VGGGTWPPSFFFFCRIYLGADGEPPAAASSPVETQTTSIQIVSNYIKFKKLYKKKWREDKRKKAFKAALSLG